MKSDDLRHRQPDKHTADFLVMLTDDLRLAGKHCLATELERCFRYSDRHAAALPAVRLIVENLT